jgi:hypothetical protein
MNAARLRAVSIAALAVPALTSIYAVRAEPSRDPIARESLAWGAVSRCVLGAPLATGERASVRARRVRLAALASNASTQLADAWPARCAHATDALSRAARADARPDAEEVARAADALGYAIASIPAPEIGEPIEALARAVEAAGITPTTSGDLVVAPDPVSALAISDFDADAALAPTAVPLDAIESDRVSAGDLRMLVPGSDADEKPRSCTSLSAGASLRCAPIAAPRHVVHFAGAAEDGVAPLVVSNDGGTSAVFRGDTGEEVGAHRDFFGGLAKKDGFVAMLGWNRGEESFELARILTSGRRSAMYYPLRIIYDSQIALLADEMVWLDASEVHARRVLDDDVPATEERSLGTVRDASVRGEVMHACMGGEGALHLLVRADGGDRIATSLNGAWSDLRTLHASGGTLSCAGATAYLARATLDADDERGVTGAFALETCGADGCALESADAESLFRRDAPAARPARPSDVAIAELGGKLLVVWRSPEGAMRMRLAPVRGLATANDQVVFDDRIRDGRVERESTLVGMRLFSRPGFAIALIATTNGVHALRIDATGAVSRVAIE